MRGDIEVGQTLAGRYRVAQQLGAGGLGAVYEVEHLGDRSRHALKVLHRQYATDAEAVSRLLREAEVARRVRSPRIVDTLEVGRLEDGRAFLLMERLEGQTWRALLQQQGSLHPQQAVRFALQVCEGLTAAHAAGVVHRDLKPDNVFLVRTPGGGEVKLLDFGLAKNLPGYTDRFGAMTEAGSAMGTPHYMSPEQAAGGRIDPSTDQYALGVMLYESLTGQPPFDGETIAEILVRIQEGQPVPLTQRAPHVPAALGEVVHRAMRRAPEDRFADIPTVARALKPFGSPARNEEQTAGFESPVAQPRAPDPRPPATGPRPATRPPPPRTRPAPAATHPRLPERRRPSGLVLAIAAPLLLAVIGAGGWLAWRAWPRETASESSPAPVPDAPATEPPASPGVVAPPRAPGGTSPLDVAERALPESISGYTLVDPPTRIFDPDQSHTYVNSTWRGQGGRLSIQIYAGFDDTAPTVRDGAEGVGPTYFQRDVEVHGETIRHWFSENETRLGGVIGGAEGVVGSCFLVRVTIQDISDADASLRAYRAVDLDSLAAECASEEG